MNKLISINPANNAIIGEVQVSTQHEIEQKVNGAHLAKELWKSYGIKRRVESVMSLLHSFKRREAELAMLIIKEMGKTVTETISDFISDFGYFQEFINHGVSYLEDEFTIRNGKMIHRIVYEPRGVVASIVPWNFPFTNFVWSVIPNLIAGNTVVFKHSEECPLVGKLIEEIIIESNVLPKGVFSEVYGGTEEGEILISQNIDMIWFTGSSFVGKKLFEIAGKKQIKAVLEMGGSNPAVLFDDINVNEIIPQIYKGRFTNCGQACDAIKRLIVHKHIYEEVVEKLVKYVEKIKIGSPEKADTELGPLAAMRQLELLESQVRDSIVDGAEIVTGGKRPEGLSGAYYLPTIVTNINRHMRIWKEEIFGPVLPIISFNTEEEAIMFANDTAYGLGAVVFSSNIERAQRVAVKIDAGFIDINQGNHWQQCNPFGGFKMSGMGCEHGRLGFQELCRFKVIAEG